MYVHYSNAFILSLVCTCITLMLFSCIDCSCVDADMTENMAAMLKTLEVLLTTYDVTSLPLKGN